MDLFIALCYILYYVTHTHNRLPIWFLEVGVKCINKGEKVLEVLKTELVVQQIVRCGRQDQVANI